MIDSAIERLKKGREERERIKKFTERGADAQSMKFDIESNNFKKTTKEDSKQPDTAKLSKSSSKTIKKPEGVVKKDSKSLKKYLVMEKPKSEEKQEESTQQVNNVEDEVKEEANDNEEKLYIDVNLGDDVKRIIVRKGDTAEALASNFATEHSIT